MRSISTWRLRALFNTDRLDVVTGEVRVGNGAPGEAWTATCDAPRMWVQEVESWMRAGPSPPFINLLKQAALARLQQLVSARFASIRQISPVQLAEWMRDRPSELVLLDVREAEEYAVSHLPGAIHIAPDATAEGLAACVRPSAMQDGDPRHDAPALLPPLKGKTVIVYCTLGVRSCRLARRALLTANRDMAPAVVYNLAGGMVRWHNEQRPLVCNAGPTEAVHPFKSHWRWLLLRRRLASTQVPLRR